MEKMLVSGNEENIFDGILFGALNNTEKVELCSMTFFMLIKNQLVNVPHSTDKEGVMKFEKDTVESHVYAEVTFFGNIYEMPIEIRPDEILQERIQLILSKDNFLKENFKHKRKLLNNSKIELVHTEDKCDEIITINLKVK